MAGREPVVNAVLIVICWAYIAFSVVCLLAAIWAHFDFNLPTFGRKERTTDES